MLLTCIAEAIGVSVLKLVYLCLSSLRCLCRSNGVCNLTCLGRNVAQRQQSIAMRKSHAVQPLFGSGGRGLEPLAVCRLEPCCKNDNITRDLKESARPARPATPVPLSLASSALLREDSWQRAALARA
jgi:hypothetical protein